MILDYGDELTTKDGQAITAAAIGTKPRGNGTAKDWGAGRVKVPYVKTTADAAPDPTTSMTVTIEGADDVGLTTNAVVLSTITILVADCAASKLYAMPPLKAGVRKAYLGVRFTPNGGNATQGKWIAGFLDENARPQNGVNSL